MLPDEVLRLPNDQSLILLRGQKPLQLSKIIPDELPAFNELIPVKITDYLPMWRKTEENSKGRKKDKPVLTITEASPLLEHEYPIFDSPKCDMSSEKREENKIGYPSYSLVHKDTSANGGTGRKTPSDFLKEDTVYHKKSPMLSNPNTDDEDEAETGKKSVQSLDSSEVLVSSILVVMDKYEERGDQYESRSI